MTTMTTCYYGQYCSTRQNVGYVSVTLRVLRILLVVHEEEKAFTVV